MKKGLLIFLLILFCFCLNACGGECSHQYDNGTIIKEATCTSTGAMKFVCELCGTDKQEAIGVLEHTESTTYKYDENGHYTYCTGCEKEINRNQHEIVDKEVIKFPTHDETGLMKTGCSSCDYTNTRVLEITNHEQSTVYSYDENGHWFDCSAHADCGIVMNYEEHDWTLINSIEATCEVEGYSYYECSLCDATKEVNEGLAEHNYSDELTYLNEEGHYYPCLVCGHKETIIDHVMVDNGIELAPTETTAGIMNTICNDCGYESTRELTPTNHHNSGVYDNDETHHWFICDEHENCSEKMEYLVHNLEVVDSLEPDCENAGYKIYKCSDCGYEVNETLEQLEHDLDEELSYDEEGHYQVCSECNFTTEKISHDYKNWVTTIASTLYTNGLQTCYCDCGKEGTKTKTIDAYANFKEHFDLSNEGVWQYGKVDYSWGESEAFEFTSLTTMNSGKDGFVGEGIEVKAGWINASNMMGISYTFEQSGNVRITLNFVGGTADTRLALRVGVKDSYGNLISNPKFYKIDSNNTLQLNENYSVEEGYTIYFIFGNEAHSNPDAWPNGELNISLTTVNVIADYKTDFDLSNEGVWQYGSIDYSWGNSETFEFTNLTEMNENEDGLIADGIEVKAGWINAGSMMAISYTATAKMNIKAIVNFVGGTSETRLSLRVGVKNSEGNLYSNPNFYGMNSVTLLETLTFELNEGDTIYFIFGNENWSTEGAYPNGELSIGIFQA